jgi:hypothetical protein
MLYISSPHLSSSIILSQPLPLLCHKLTTIASSATPIRYEVRLQLTLILLDPPRCPAVPLLDAAQDIDLVLPFPVRGSLSTDVHRFFRHVPLYSSRFALYSRTYTTAVVTSHERSSVEGLAQYCMTSRGTFGLSADG